MFRQEVVVGSVTVALSALLLVQERLFLEKTAKGQRLVRWFGPNRAAWVLRVIALAFMTFGVLLAAGIIHPIQW